MKLLLIILLAAMPVIGQAHSHVDDSFERFEVIRLLPPAEILYLERVEAGWKLEYKLSSKLQIRYGAVTLTKETQIDQEVLTKPKGKLVWLLICSLDDHVYAVVPVLPSQIRRK